MAEERVHVVGPFGEAGTVDASELKAVVESGGRLATNEEIAATRLAEQYDQASAADKVLGFASIASPLTAVAGVGVRPPTVEAYRQGAEHGMTAGLSQAVKHEAIKHLAGSEAAKEYAKNLEDLQAAHGTAFGAGEVAGMVGGAVMGSAGGLGAAGRAIPSVGISAIGNAAEQSAARALTGLAAKGTLGKAAATGLAFGAQGAVEGVLYGAANQVSEDMLADKDVAADRVLTAAGISGLYGLLGGTALGAGGSLAASGAKHAGEAAARGIARMAGGADGGLSTAAKGKLKDAADDLAFDALGTTRKVADKLNDRVPGGSRAVGEWVNKEVLPSVGPAARADELLPVIQAKRAAIGEAIGEKVALNDARVPVFDIVKDAADIQKAMLSDARMIHGAEPFLSQVERSFHAFKNGGLVAEDGTMSLSALYKQRAQLETAAYELGRKTAAGDAFKQWLRKLDDTLVSKIDDVGKAAGRGSEASELMSLKRQYQLAKSAEKAAEDGVNRIQGNNVFGLRESFGAGSVLAGGLAAANPILALGGATATAVGGKLMRERGAAAAARLLYRVADLGAIAKAANAVETQMANTAKGLVKQQRSTASRRLPPPRDPVKFARTAEKRITEIASKPDAIARRAETLTRGMADVAPTVAAKVTASLARSAAFLYSKLPPIVNVDPLAPKRERHWTPPEAEKFARYVEAAEDPMGVLEDFERGKVTPEAVETIKVLAPTVYQDLQDKVLEQVAESMASGKPIPFETRNRLGLLFGVPADPSHNPKVRQFLQNNVSASANQAQSGKLQSTGQAQRPLKIATQHSTFDRVSEGRPGK